MTHYHKHCDHSVVYISFSRQKICLELCSLPSKNIPFALLFFVKNIPVGYLFPVKKTCTLLSSPIKKYAFCPFGSYLQLLFLSNNHQKEKLATEN